MGSVTGDDCDDVYSVIGDKGEIGFLDFEDDKSVCGFDPIDEGPIVISSPFPFVGGKPQSAPIGETTVDSITIRNSTSDPVELWGIRIFDSNPKDTYALSLMEPPSATADEETIRSFLGTSSLEDRVLQPNQTLTVWLSCKPNDIGLHTSVVHFDVGDDKVERVVFLLAEDKVSQSLASNKPYSRVPRRRQFASDKYVAGSRPLRKGTQGFKYRLPQYAIPANVRELIANKQVPEVLLEGLTRENYASFFSTLLIMEELHMEDDMRGHDMENVTMRRRGNRFLSLEVSGLAERRPSLVYGDYIFAVPATNSDNTTQRYQGFIHRIEADEVFLEFAKEFHQRHSDGNIYNVSFTYNRVNMRRLYQAIQAAQDLGNELLFPSQSSRRSITTYSIVPYNQSINQEQKTAVEMIVNCKGSPPYVIHGPPGTGKTLTIVEAILQLYTTIKSARVLVCAASNSAADHVLEKLINMEIVNIKETEIFRLNASSRPYEDVRQDHIRFCFFEDSIFKCPPLKALLRYKIIISTYMSTSLLYADGIRRGHFSHIFLDEAGQASEPETMIPLANLCQRETVVVLAGDPMQLGPVIYSTDAESFGLGKSYMGRLFECQLYDDEDENFVIKLVRNYRCHPAILELPSKLFYKGELIACKEDRDSTICEWLDLPNKSFPVHFVGVQGCDEREGSNPSWFNRIEASKVVDIIKKLTKNPDVSKEDIGVITPYRQQVMKLKKALETFGMLDVKVGSVEQFQGQEREIIIISTVRSTVKHNEFDRTHNLGFLGNEKRFNVAITRAKSLLIIVGNPHIICKDPYWDKLLRHCSDNNSYQGCPLPPPEKLDDYAEEEGSSVQEHNFTKPGTNEVEWGDETGNFNPKFSDEVEWGDETVKFNPKFSDEVEWGDETVKFSAKFSDEVEWGNETVKVPEIPKPVTDEAEWSDGWR